MLQREMLILWNKVSHRGCLCRRHHRYYFLTLYCSRRRKFVSWWKNQWYFICFTHKNMVRQSTGSPLFESAFIIRPLCKQSNTRISRIQIIFRLVCLPRAEVSVNVHSKVIFTMLRRSWKGLPSSLSHVAKHLGIKCFLLWPKLLIQLLQNQLSLIKTCLVKKKSKIVAVQQFGKSLLWRISLVLFRQQTGQDLIWKREGETSFWFDILAVCQDNSLRSARK